MTPAEWHASTDALALFAAAPPGARRARLFLVACLRPHLDDGRSAFRQAVGVAEEFADGLASGRELEAAWEAVFAPFGLGMAASWACIDSPHADASYRLGRAQHCLYALAEASPGRPLRAAHAALFRCLTPPPFAPAVCRPEWLTSAVVGIAASIYDGRNFHDCPILADAFEDAGCDNAELLAHLRGPGPHARGCWPVDLALGRDLSA